MRKLFYILNFSMLGVFILAAAVDHQKDWRKYQSEYFERAAQHLEADAAKASDPEEKKALLDQADRARHEPIVVRQIIVKDLPLPGGVVRVDRCITCHVGMDEFSTPSSKTPMITPFSDQPFTGHPDISGLVKNHNFQKFGCTVCHEGQGIATDMNAAHGYMANWEKPLLKGPMIQASCAKCHDNFETLHGAETVAMGRKLFETHGCRGCHTVHGFGQTVSVDLSDIADKPLERIAPYNFSLVKLPGGKPLPERDWKLPAWIFAHLTNVPMSFIPNDPFSQFNKEPIAPSGMPDFTQDFNADEATAVTTYLLSLTDEEAAQIPYRYHVSAPPKSEPKFAGAIDHGHYVFHKYGCEGCHGIEAKAGRRNYNAMGPGQPPLDQVKNDPQKLGEAMAMGREPTLPDVLGTYTRDELRAKIQEGVPSTQIAKYNPDGPMPPLFMPSWKERIKGQELEDLLSFLMSIGKKQESW